MNWNEEIRKYLDNLTKTQSKSGSLTHHILIDDNSGRLPEVYKAFEKELTEMVNKKGKL